MDRVFSLIRSSFTKLSPCCPSPQLNKFSVCSIAHQPGVSGECLANQHIDRVCHWVRNSPIPTKKKEKVCLCIAGIPVKVAKMRKSTIRWFIAGERRVALPDKQSKPIISDLQHLSPFNEPFQKASK